MRIVAAPERAAVDHASAQALPLFPSMPTCRAVAVLALAFPACEPVFDAADASPAGEQIDAQLPDPLPSADLDWRRGGDSTGADPDAQPSCMSAEWIWPVPSNENVAQKFGNPITYQSCGFHTGLDISAKADLDILAAASGVVVHVGPLWYQGVGKGRGPFAIILDHGGGVYSTYGHGSAALVEVGDCASAGQVIGKIGSLGFSSGPHLHFEVLSDTSFTGDWTKPFDHACDHYLDPLPLFAADE